MSTEDGLELLTFLCPPPKYWDYRSEPPQLVTEWSHNLHWEEGDCFPELMLSGMGSLPLAGIATEVKEAISDSDSLAALC